MTVEAVDIRDDLDAYKVLTGKAKNTVGARLLRAHPQIEKKQNRLAAKLEEYDNAMLEAAKSGNWGPEESKLQETWLAKLKEYEHLCDMQCAIENEVLYAGQ